MTVRRFSLAMIILAVVLVTSISVVPSASAATLCGPASSISVPFSHDGAGDFCWQTTSLCTYVNSWNLTTLEINGTAYTNVYVSSSTVAPLNGAYTIHYVSTVDFGHVEIGAPCSGGGGATSTPTSILAATATRTATQGSGPTATRTKTATTAPSATRTITATAGPSATATRTVTQASGPTATKTKAPTSTKAPSKTRTPTKTATPGGPTATAMPSQIRTATVAPTFTRTSTAITTNCGSLAICDGFESQTIGAAPSGGWQMIFPDCQGTGAATVDSAQAHSGAKSVRVDGKTGYCNHVFFGNTSSVASIGSLVYGRVFIRASTALGVDHVTFIAMKDVNDGGKNLRFGGQGQVMAWNRESDDATVPSMSPAGISTSAALPANQWSCLEFMVDGTNGYLQAWLNGTNVAGLTVDGVATTDIDAQWKTRTNWHPSLSDVKLGWESYSSGDNTLWFDDVAFGSARIGCGT